MRKVDLPVKATFGIPDSEIDEIGGSIMSDKGSVRIWLLVVLAVALGGVGYFLYSVSHSNQAKKEAAVEVAVVEEPGIQPGTANEPAGQEKKEGEPSIPQKSGPASREEARQIVKGKIGNELLSTIEPGLPPGQGEQYCKKMEEYVVDYFKYLDENKQKESSGDKIDSFDRFKQILKDLEKRPPIPAGEGSNPTVMIANIFYFSRALDRKDIDFIRKIIGSDKDTVEINMDMFFRWLMLDGQCPESNGFRPSFDVLYKYAGFFLNSTGGRAYMFRRSTPIRLLTTYYSLLIIHKADRLGLNQYGMDIVPFIKSAKQDIGLYPDFEFQNEYMNNLLSMEKYYLKRR